MKFPISIVFERKLNIIVDEENTVKILGFIRDEIVKRKADNVIIENSSVSAKGSSLGWDTSLLQIADKATFSLLQKNDESFIRYQLDMPKLFIHTTVIAAIFEVLGLTQGNVWWIGFGAFGWLCGANWLTAYLRHGLFVSELAEGIDILMGWKQPKHEDEEKDESLKSWF